MQTMRSTILMTLICSFMTLSLQAQEPPVEYNDSYSAAYAESGHVTHWSVYIPVVALVAAAIWLGFQDGSHSNRSVGGNGSLADSSKRSGSYSHSGSYSSR